MATIRSPRKLKYVKGKSEFNGMGSRVKLTYSAGPMEGDQGYLLDGGERVRVLRRGAEQILGDDAPSGKLSKGDISGIIEAMEQLEWVQWVKARMVQDTPAAESPVEESGKPATPVEAFRKHRLTALRYQAEAESATTQDQFDRLQYQAEQAWHQANEVRRQQSARARDYALARGCSYEAALTLLDIPHPDAA